MIFPILWSIYFNEMSIILSFGLTIIIGLTFGFLLYFIGRNTDQKGFYRKEGLAVVTLGWIISALLGALPFYISRVIPSFVDAFFETMSGFTTTGATILINIEEIPMGLLFWRSLTHWLGGMGIIVLFVAVLPAMGISGKFMYKM
ncbi:TrkH family potassium uptake protein, partial [bacterium]|nr:TrkH family potassium uptake protein [bacterium]